MKSSMFMLLPMLISGCASQTPEWCVDRADDEDCDGVPENWDHCPSTAPGDLTDRRGCSEAQAVGCTVNLLEPEDGARLDGSARFRWQGDCDVWLLQFSQEPDFPAGATRTALRTQAQEVLAEGSESWWRVVGGMEGVSAGVYSEPRQVKKWR